MGFVLFLLVTTALFVRPAEVIPGLEDVPTYQILIVACLVCSFPQAMAQLSPRSFVERPINLCVLLILIAIALSHITHGQLGLAYDSCMAFSKVAIYYLLLVSNVNSFGRLRTFLALLTALIPVVAGLALLQYHGVINLPTLRIVYETQTDPTTGLETLVPRICATGIFNDPNDLAMIVVFGILLCVYWFTERDLALLRPLVAASLGFLGYALAMTRSRGGLVALLAAMAVLFHARFGWRRTLPLMAVVLPAMLVLGGRQTDIGGAVEGGTGQQRIQLWAEGVGMFKRAPLFGIGHDQFAEEAWLAAHNSYIHCYAELGFFGGTAFFGAFYCALDGLRRLGQGRAPALPRDAIRLRPYLTGTVAGFAVSMLSISRSYVEPTYIMLGLSASYLSLAMRADPAQTEALHQSLLKRVTVGSVTCMVAIYVVVRVMGRWSS